MKRDTFKKVDKELLERLKLGDETAFEYLYWNYNSYLFNFINSLLFDYSLAEDLTQTVFLKIWERRNFIEPEKGMEAYLFTIARHLVYKETEKKLKYMSVPLITDGIIDEEDKLMEQTIDANSLQNYINSLIDLLPKARKEIFMLSRVQHLTNKEIAQRLSISEKTVENQITHALHFLKNHLSEDTCVALLLLYMANNC